jgi:retron-type reverse transcriptase
MAKTYKKLFNECFTIDALFEAFNNAKKGKRNKHQVVEFTRKLGVNIVQLHKEIHDGTYEPLPYKNFKVYEPKERIIYAPHFRDTIVQHAIYSVIYPIFDKGFIDDNYGCRVGKGTHRAANKTQEFMRNSKDDNYFLQLDIRKFFYRIDRDILFKLIQNKIKDDKLLVIIKKFIRYPDVTGIPIGNLLSQLFALIYLNPVDHYIKRELKCKLYVRYVDDFVLFNLPKETANDFKNKIEKFISDNLKLELSKFNISKVNNGINFVGYRTKKRTRLIRKHSLYNFKKKLKQQKIDSINSITSHALNTTSFDYLCELAILHDPCIVLKLPLVYKRVIELIILEKV